jgi:anti-sigma factor RsiW
LARKNRTREARYKAYTCKKATSLITEYVAGTLAPHITRELENHLGACPDCVAFLKTYKKTLEATRLLLASGALPKIERSQRQAVQKNISDHSHSR